MFFHPLGRFSLQAVTRIFCDCLQRIPSQTGSTLKGKKMVLEELILFVRIGPHLKVRHENREVVSPKNVSMRSCS